MLEGHEFAIAEGVRTLVVVLIGSDVKVGWPLINICEQILQRNEVFCAFLAVIRTSIAFAFRRAEERIVAEHDAELIPIFLIL